MTCSFSIIRLETNQKVKNIKIWRRSQDGGGVGRGEHFLPHQFIKRAFKRRVNSTKQLLNAGRGHQAPRKAAPLRKELPEKVRRFYTPITEWQGGDKSQHWRPPNTSPELLGSGKNTKRRPNRVCASEDYPSA